MTTDKNKNIGLKYIATVLSSTTNPSFYLFTMSFHSLLHLK